MTEEVETIEQAPPSQRQTDATAESSTATQDAPAESSTAKGDKKPKSMADAMSQVKLEQPATETRTEDSPSPEQKAESGKAAADKAGAKDEQPEKEAKAEGSTNDLFDKRPEWTELNKALGVDGAKKARPIIRQLMEREHRATEAVRQYKPVVDELKRYTGDEKGFTQMKNVVRAYAEGDPACVPVLEQMLQDLKTRAGHVVSSPDLKQRLSAIDKKVEDGLMDEETAKLAREAIAEAEKSRAGAKSAKSRAEQTETERKQEAQRQQGERTMQTINAWEESIRSRDPDFGNVTPDNDPRHGESVADRVFDALKMRFMQNPNVTGDELVAEANRVHKLARGQLARPVVREQKVVTSNGSSSSAKPRPKTMREAMDSVRLE